MSARTRQFRGFIFKKKIRASVRTPAEVFGSHAALPDPKNDLRRRALWLAMSFALTSCAGTLDKLEQVGTPPQFAKVDDPTAKPGYQPISWPLPAQSVVPKHYSNSLWQPGARAFFRDQRASRIGDILRVKIQIDDKAQLDNKTDRKRDSSDSVAAPKLFGMEGKLGYLTPGTPDRDSLFDITGESQAKGEGKVDRKERIETMVAAAITQVLPNGNYVIEGSQEIRVNYDIREIAVAGVVRPEDIDSDNTVDSSKIAMARINYGGRGQLMDAQQSRWGSQVVDVLSPF